MSGKTPGICIAASAGTDVYDNLPTFWVGNDIFMIFLPDAVPRSASSGSPVKIIFSPGGISSRSPIALASCPSGTIAGVGSTMVTIVLPDGENCDLVVISPNGTAGSYMSYAATLSRSGNAYSVSAGTLTGDIFGGRVGAPLTLASTQSSRVQVGQLYSQATVASGGTSPYNYSVSAGSLPAGTSLDTAGVVSGTPTAEGPFNYTILVTDSGSPVQTAAQTVSGTIAAAALTVASVASAIAQVGQPYLQSNIASGGTPPYAYTVSNGALPPGTSLNASSGLVAGVPATPGPFSYALKIVDSGNPIQTATQTLAGTIAPAVALQVTPTTDIVAVRTLDGPVEPSSFVYSLAANGGTASFAISNVPSWLSASTISGTATPSGVPVTFSITESARALPAGKYSSVISFTNPGGMVGHQTRSATLTVGQCNTRLGDLNGDVRADMVLRRDDGVLAAYFMNGANVASAAILGQLGLEWSLVGVADFDGDARADLLFRRTDGTLALYLMSGAQVLAAQIIGNIGNEWKVVGVGDFNGDGRADFLLRRTDGMMALYLMNGFQLLNAQTIGQVGTEWSLAQVADFDGDGRADFIMRRTDGMLALFLMNGIQVTSASLVGQVGTEWSVVAAGDFNGDARADMLLRRADGMLAMYLMNGPQVLAAQAIGTVGLEWRLVGIGDLNADGRADMVLRRTDGMLSVYLMNGFQVQAAQLIGGVASEWGICYGEAIALQ